MKQEILCVLGCLLGTAIGALILLSIAVPYSDWIVSLYDRDNTNFSHTAQERIPTPLPYREPKRINIFEEWASKMCECTTKNLTNWHTGQTVFDISTCEKCGKAILNLPQEEEK